MLHNHLVCMQPSLDREPATQTNEAYLRPVSEHNSISYWDEATVMSLRLPAWHRILLQSILQTAVWVSLHIQKPKAKGILKNKIEKFPKLFDGYNTVHKKWWG